MRVVVTGGAGFIGRALVNRLAQRGVDVVVLVRDQPKPRTWFSRASPSRGAT